MAKNEKSSLAKSLWGLAIAQGVLAILFGIVALFWPGLTVALFITLFSIFLLVWGIVGAIVGLSSIGRHGFWWIELLFGVLAIGLAVFMLRNPIDAAEVFVTLIGLTFLVRGIVDLLEGLFDRSRSSDGRLFAGISGAIGIIAGIVTLLYPVSAGLAVVWVIGLYAIFFGVLAIAFGFRVQKELE